MRVASGGGIGDIIDKLRDDEDKSDGHMTIDEAAKDDVLKSLADFHPDKLNAKSRIGVVVNAILMFRDKYFKCSKEERENIVKHVLALNGSISDPSLNTFHISFSKCDDNVSISVLNDHIDVSTNKFYFRIHVPFSDHGIGKMHIFPLINLETGVNHSLPYWCNKSGEFLCTSDIPGNELNQILNYVASINFNLGVTVSAIDVREFIDKDDK